MARGTTYTAEAIITAKDQASRVATRVSKSYQRMARNVSRSADRVAAASARAVQLAGAAAVAGVGLAIREAARFEDKMADVKKVVDFDSPEGFSNLRKDLFELAKEIPRSQAELAEIAAVAGQAGTAQEDLAAFTELAAKSSIAFNMEAFETADALAQVREQLKLSHEELIANVDVTNTLANNFNTSESKLLDYNKRVAATGELAGFANAETQAFGTAMIAMGAESNVAATSFRNMTKALGSGEAATKAQRKAFKKLGLDSKKISKAMQKDAVGTVIDLMEKLKELPKEAQKTTLTQLFGSEARALEPLLNNLDLLKQTLAIAKDSQKTAGAVDKEFKTRMQTTTAQYELFKNRLRALSINVGEKILPSINAAFGPVADGIEQFVDFSVQKFEELKALLDGFANGLGFENSADAFRALGDQLSELFGTEDLSNGEKLAQIFKTGQEAAELFKSALTPLIPVMKGIGEAATQMGDALGVDGGTIGALIVAGAGLKLTGTALRIISGGLWAIARVPIKPIWAIVKAVAKLAALSVGLGGVAGNLKDVSKSLPSSSGRGAAKGAGAKAAGRGGGLLGAGLRLAKRHPVIAGVATGAAGIAAFDSYIASDGQKQMRREAEQRRMEEEKRRLNDTAGFDANGMPMYRYGGRPQPQTGGGADQRDRMDPRTRFPIDEVENVRRSLGFLAEKAEALSQPIPVDLKEQFVFSPNGNVSAEVTAPVTAELEGKADINVRVKVDGGRVVGTSVNSSGHVAPSVGTDLTAEPGQ